MNRFRKVIVGMSGGVDSAVTALLLKRKGYNVQGVFMQNWDIADETGHCAADADYKDAQDICDILKIDLIHVNFVKHYWNEVFCDFIKEYESGFTPNPDINCNRNIKFKYFYKYAIENLNADAIATGHYARSSFGQFLENYEENLVCRLLAARDYKKDQTLFLSQIGQQALRKTMFPLGDLLKSEVKAIAMESKLERIAFKRESMGICFIGSRNFQNFIQEYIEDKPGDFVNLDTGKVVGRHNGIHQWTLGQRSKVSGLSEACFTARKDVEKHIIYIAQGTKHPILRTNIIFTLKPHWIAARPQDLIEGNILFCQFKFQHVEKWENCSVCETPRGLVIKLEETKRAITPGQYAVLMDKNGECLGSARICNTGISHFSLYYLENHNILKVSTFLNRNKQNECKTEYRNRDELEIKSALG